MSGGIAYVLDREQTFARLCNMEMVELEKVTEPNDVDLLRGMIEKHLEYTNSQVASEILKHWEEILSSFVKVIPVDYKNALAELIKEREAAAQSVKEVESHG